MADAIPDAWHRDLRQLETQLSPRDILPTGIPGVRIMRIVALMSGARLPRYGDAAVFGKRALGAWYIAMRGGDVPGIDWSHLYSLMAQSAAAAKTSAHARRGPSFSMRRLPWRATCLVGAIGAMTWFMGHGMLQGRPANTPILAASAPMPVANHTVQSGVVATPPTPAPIHTAALDRGAVSPSLASPQPATTVAATPIVRPLHARTKPHHVTAQSDIEPSYPMTTRTEVVTRARHQQQDDPNAFDHEVPGAPIAVAPVPPRSVNTSTEWANQIVQRRLTDDPAFLASPH